MEILRYTEQKIVRFLDRVSALQAGAHAQGDSIAALAAIYKLFDTHRETLKALQAPGVDAAVVANHCQVVLGALFQYLPLLGFLHRSKSASNAFELYGPLRSLAAKIIGPDARLILSSEWDFSPLTWVRMLDFPQYVLLGLPASEARNGLLMPLAGHEFGHSVWVRGRYSASLKSTLVDSVILNIRARIVEWTKHFPSLVDETKLPTDLFYVQAWLRAYQSAMLQCEETFCDILGLLLFGTSYLHAFAYLLAPGIPGARSPGYPSIRQRAGYLAELAGADNIDVPNGYVELFNDTPKLSDPDEDFLVSIADTVVHAQLSTLSTAVRDHLAACDYVAPTSVEIEEIAARYALLAPAGTPSSLAALVNAGWRVAVNADIWQEFPQVRARRDDVLNELVIKSAQVLEFTERVTNAS